MALLSLAALKTTAEIFKAVADIAKDATKPVTDAVIAPKVEHLRKQAVENALQGEVKGVLKDLDKAFANHLRLLHRRVSTIKTIAHQNDGLPLLAIYEPLALKSQASNKIISEDILKQPGTCTYIIDNGGVGKSTFSKHFVLRAIESGPSIPLFLELRRVTSGQTLIDALAQDLDGFGQKFDRDVFRRLLGVAHFIIVLDGFDEVASDDRPLLISQIEELALHCEHSAIVLTSRPEIALPSMPQAKALTIEPPTREQARLIVLRLDAFSSEKVGEELVSRFNQAPSLMLQTPLLIALLYRTYSFTRTINGRVTTFYDALFEALFSGHDLTKSAYNRTKKSNLGIEEFRKLLRGFCFFIIKKQMNMIPSRSSATDVIKEAEKLTGVRPSSYVNWFDDLLVAVPLLVREGTEFRFVHKTIAEVFAAEHIAFGNHGQTLLTTIVKPEHIDKFAGVLSFLREIYPEKYLQAVAAPVAKLALDTDKEKTDLVRAVKFFGLQYIRLDQMESDFSAETLTDVNLNRVGPPSENHNMFAYMLKDETLTYEVSYAFVKNDNLYKKAKIAWYELSYRSELGFLVEGELPSSDVIFTLTGKDWVSLSDHRITDNYNSKSFVSVFIVFLFNHVIGRLIDNTKIRLLSDEECMSVLERVKEYEDNESWVLEEF